MSLPEFRPMGRRRTFPYCATPRCSEPKAEGSRFCAAHAEQLARFKTEMDEAAARYGRHGRGKKGPPRCCRPGCDEVRIAPAAFCDGCQAAGYREETE